MADSKKEKHLPAARALYAEGLDYVEVAEALKMSVGTVRSWATQDRKAGDPWRRDNEPEVPAKPPAGATGRVSREALFGRLEERLQRLIERSEEDLDDAKIEDRMLKVCRVLESLRGDAADLDAQLEAMKRFADFCLQNLTEDEMSPVRTAIRQFVDYLKEEHS